MAARGLQLLLRGSKGNATPRFNTLFRSISGVPIRAYSESSSSSLQSSNEENLSLVLTDECVKQIHKIAGSGSFLRVLVDSGGCSGFQYKFELDNKINEDDRVFEKDGAKLIIDCDSLGLITGSTIDFQSELIRSAFRVLSNPKAEHGCSCGASFTVKL